MMKLNLLNRSIAMFVALLLVFAFVPLQAQKYVYEGSWADAGFNLTGNSAAGVEITFSVDEITLTDFDLKGEAMKEIHVYGSFLPNNEGAPNLPGNGRFIAVPNGANVNYTITAQRTETIKNVNIAPSPRIPKVTDSGPMHYEKNMKIYSRDAFYPANPVTLSEKTSIRGVEAVILGITPFQYNPVSKELIVYHDLKVEVSFEGGSNQFGEDRLRSRWFDPILSDMMINYESLSAVQYPSHSPESLTADFEYVIITPDDDTFISWAEELALFRNMQGIRTGIFTTTEIGGNTTIAIESFVDDAYANWAVPPVAVLLLGDYGTSGNTVVSPIWDSYCVSDNIYADVTGNDMPDVIFARMTAQNETHLETMITKVIDYETDPPTDPDFYYHPITALGWQTERWFQICSETVGGYFKHVHSKDPVRINAIYSGTPGSVWSTATNTADVVDYFGPNGTAYIPQTPAELGGWSGGTANMVVDAINDGSFMLQHRDHGYELGWGEPDFNNSHISQLTNTDLCFIFSINCLTGKYNYGSESFAEKFHRHTYNGENSGALGLIAASEVSYSFVNDTYVWGLFDNMWPDFMPDNQTDPMPRGLLPAFGNAAGKYFLEQSDWPYNTNNKEVTYNLFHHHGCAFSTLYSEVPMDLTVLHENVMLAEMTQFSVTADDGALIALSVEGEIIGTGIGTGAPVDITVLPQIPPTVVDIVVTKTNYFRYHAQIDVIPPNGPYVVQNEVSINDEAGNNNGQMDYGESILLNLQVKNVGTEDGENVEVTVSSDDDNITITQAVADYGTVPAGQVKLLENGFALDVAGSIPDMHTVIFDVVATNGTDIWESSFFLKGHSPNLSFIDVSIDDAAGNGNGRLDPGETVNLLISVENSGSADGYEVIGELLSADPFITINTASMDYGDISSGEQNVQSYNITTNVTTPPGYSADFNFDIDAFGGVSAQGFFSLIIGQIPILIIDLDRPPQNSGPQMRSAIQELGIGVEYTQSWPTAGLDMYSNIFVCLGIYSDNHVLTQSEGNALAAYLNEGGNLYMEGGDTWYYDTETAVHPMFKINKVADGSGDLDILNGQAGAFTEGMTFNYGGDNNYIDQITAISPAFEIFQNNNPSYYAAVAYHAGSYRTIGCSFEFGGLANGTGINTRVSLMEEYLNFFGIRKVNEAPGLPDGNDEVCAASEVPYTTNSIEGADFYYWQVVPANAGVVNGTDTSIMILWSADYTGSAHVKVCGLNNTGAGPTSDSLLVMVNAAPSATMSGMTTICEGDDVELTVYLSGMAPWTFELDNESYTTSSSPYTVTVSPLTSTGYSVTSVEDAGGCVNAGTGETQVDVMMKPEKAATPGGPDFVNSDDDPTSTFTTSGAGNADTYEWMVSPSSAYTDMSVSDMELTVTWDNEYNGDVSISVRGLSGDCEGEYSDEFSVALESHFGIDEIAKALGFNVYPNPNKGSFTLELATNAIDKVNIRIVNAIGHVVYQEQDLMVNNNLSTVIDISNESEGIYLMVIESDLGVYTSRIIIQK